VNTAPDLGLRIERWRPAVGWVGFYQVSDLGRVASVDRWVLDSLGRLMHRRGKVLRQSVNGSGHMRVKLYRCDGRPVTCFVHHLVLDAFDRPRRPGEECRHGRGGPADNRWPENICWGTHAENHGPDRVRDGTDNRGERHYAAKLTAAIVRDCRARAAAGEQTTALAAEYGVTHHVMSKAINRKTWRHVALRSWTEGSPPMS
jgi:hypothetical protein